MELKDKIALVTGANRGIGKAIAIELGKLGATIIGADIDQEKANQITEYLKQNNFNGRGIVMNVTDQESITTALNTIRKEFGAPAILINNAGITRDNLMLRMKPEEWQAVIDTNLNSVFKVTQACLRDMVKARWGRVINITSVVGLTGNAGQANYASAKAGIIAFGRSLAQEVASRGITVNAIAPGYVATQMTGTLSEEQKEAFLRTIPMQKPAQPEEIAYLTAFLISEKASYITGETININGGMFMN